MFDIGFSELVVIGIVALVVLGPERMPKAARFAGLWVRRARAQWYSVKAELERELAAEELKRTLQDTRQAMNDLPAGRPSAGDDARREFEAMQAQLRQTAADAQAPALPQPAADPAPEPATDTTAGAPDDRR
jgi:sec-independent protein translocase protein TatB